MRNYIIKRLLLAVVTVYAVVTLVFVLMRLIPGDPALRNAMLPVITILGLQFGFALGGLVVVEAASNLPGAGRFLLDATIRRDYNVVQASLFAIAIFVTMANLIVDILYAWLNPRIRYE